MSCSLRRFHSFKEMKTGSSGSDGLDGGVGRIIGEGDVEACVDSLSDNGVVGAECVGLDDTEDGVSCISGDECESDDDDGDTHGVTSAWWVGFDLDGEACSFFDDVVGADAEMEDS